MGSAKIPEALLKSLEGVAGFDREGFINVHAEGRQVTSVRYNPLKPVDIPAAYSRIPWSGSGYYLPERPFFTFDPRLHAGVYYVQEASSMFLEQAFHQSVDVEAPLRILDLCAAPGGKSTLLQSLISNESLLVSNDVIKSRSNILEENLTKWGAGNVVVTNNDPKDFAKLEGFFDVIVVDAPCSGSGLFRRDPTAIDEWSEQNVELCCQRQQRILADVYPALKKDGILIYSTCSYSESEDEEIADWLIDEFELTNIPLLFDSDWGIVQTSSIKHYAQGYRFYPDKVRGEGFFIACFKKNEGNTLKFKQPKKSVLQRLSKEETAVVLPWLKDGAEISLWKHGDLIIAFPATLGDVLIALADKLYLRKAGIAIGKIAGKDLIPEHSLALSDILNEKTVGISLNLQDALQYLRKEEVKMDISHRGWALVLYDGIKLGWIKVLSNRTNNYYPKEWRILKS
ncbi:MAG: RNA methyltransferase [Chitinophagaceae bacterium]|nr:MAG: RNA methyltransferase [Chitinophagaceae bacterium]